MHLRDAEVGRALGVEYVFSQFEVGDKELGLRWPIHIRKLFQLVVESLDQLFNIVPNYH